jgi:bacteriorhodopsin
MTSRYHFVLLVLPYTVLVAACLADDRMRVLGGTVLFASFMLLTGTSNEVVGTAVSEFAYSYGFFVMGTLLLLVPLGAVVWYFRSPGPDVKRAACAARFGPHELEFPFDSFD